MRELGEESKKTENDAKTAALQEEVSGWPKAGHPERESLKFLLIALFMVSTSVS